MENNHNIRLCSSVTQFNKRTFQPPSSCRLSWGCYHGSCRSCDPQPAPFNLEKSISCLEYRGTSLNTVQTTDVLSNWCFVATCPPATQTLDLRN